ASPACTTSPSPDDRQTSRSACIPQIIYGTTSRHVREHLRDSPYYGSRLLYAGVPENDVADWMGHSSTDVLREHYHYIFEGAEQRGRAAIATMLTPGADDPTEASEVA
ncbi:hypothetical protein ACPCIY_19550, partial [Streptomyces thermodiastaticus]